MRTFVNAWVLSLLLLVAGCVTSGFRGSTIPPYPAGWQEEGGACIGQVLGNEHVCDYSIGIMEKASRRIMYLGKRVMTDADSGESRWHILDTMPYPQAPTGYQVVFGRCEFQGQKDGRFIAVVKTIDAEWFTTVHAAYRANLQEARFEKTSTEGIRCRNGGWGL